MALAGHDTAYLVFNVTSTATVRSGTLTGVVAGERVVAVLAIDGNTNTQDPSTYTVTLGSDTLSHIVSNTTTLNEGFSAIFSGVATASGDQTLSVTTPNSTRAMACHAFRITGFDTTTPHPNSGQTKPGSNSTSLTSPNGVTTAADGNAIIGGISIHGGDITGLAVGAADGSTTGQTGTDAFSDCEWGVAWDRTPTAASVTFAWTWTGSDRPGAAWVEVAEAAGGTTVDAPAGSYTLTGHAPTNTRQLLSAADAGAYTLTGHAPTITTAANINAPAGSYTLAGHAPAITRALVLAVPSGAYVLAGLAPTITTTGTVDVPAGSYTLTGYAPLVHVPTGSDATWNAAWALWSGAGATWTAALVVSADAGSYTLTGYAPTLARALLIQADVGSYGLTGYAPQIVTAGTISADAGAYTLTGLAPAVTRALRVDAPTGSYSLTGHAPSVSTAGTVDAQTGSYSLSGHAPAIRRSLILSVPAGTYAITGNAPAITVQGLINYITLASNSPPSFRALGGKGSIRAIGGGG